MIHIGISGPIGSGKSTLARQLTQHFSARIIPFATGVYAIAALEYEVNRLDAIAELITSYGATYPVAYVAASMIDAHMKRYPSEPGIKNRRLLQFIGTEAGRDTIHEDIWVDVVTSIMNAGDMVDVVISDDVRFENEVHAVDLHVRIDTADNECYDNRKAGLSTQYTFSDHASEHGVVSEPDYTIPACWSDDDLQTLIEIITLILD